MARSGIGLFGSAVHDDFERDSDVDPLIRRAIAESPNWIRRQAILESAEPFDVVT